MILLFLLYEIGLFAAALAFAVPICGRVADPVDRRDRFVLLWLASKLYLGALLGLAVTALRMHHIATYLVIAGVGAVALTYVLVTRRGDVAAVLGTWADTYSRRFNVLLWSLIALFVPPLFINISPSRQFDTIHITQPSVLRWAENAVGPYTRVWGNGSFWESGYLAANVLTGTDQFWWWTTFQAVLLVGIGGYLLALRRGLRSWLALLVVAQALTLYHYWFKQGVMSVKSDFALASGFVLLAYVIHQYGRPQRDWALRVLGAFAIALMLSKGLGLPLSVLLLLLLLGVSVPLRHLRKEILLIGGVALGLFLAANGSEVIYKLFVYGNPVYPMQLKIAGYGFTGLERKDMTGTSILSQIANPDTWRLILDVERFPGHLAGILFLPSMLSFLLLALWAVVQAGWKRTFTPLQLVVLAAAVFWFVYLIAPVAAQAPGRTDLNYLRELKSLRYAAGALMVTEILVFSTVARLWHGVWISAVLAAASMASRLWMLYVDIPTSGRGALTGNFVPDRIFIGGLVFVLVFGLLLTLPRQGGRRLAALALVVLVFLLASPKVFEANRKTWIRSFRFGKEAFMTLRRAPPSSVYVVEKWVACSEQEKRELCDARDPYMVDVGEHCYITSTSRYRALPFVAGQGWRHTVTGGPVEELESAVQSGEPPPKYVTAIVRRGCEITEDNLEKLESRLNGLGYAEARLGPRSVVYRQRARDSPSD